MSIREVKEGTQYQGVDEEITYTLDVTSWGSSPTSPSVVGKQAGADVTSTIMPVGSPSVSSNVITLPKIKSLTADLTYRVEVKFTVGGNVVEAYFDIAAST